MNELDVRIINDYQSSDGLRKVTATSCRYTYGVCEQYGTGATAVTIR